MKYLKKIIIGCLCMFPMLVNAGSISLNNPIRISNEKYTFTLTIKDLDLNYISGKIKITNGFITKITMANGWENKTGTNNNFYFYKDGLSKGNYLVATFEVTMTGNSEYTLSDFQYGANLCKKDNYGNYIGKNGNIVNETTYKNECEKSKDATLKSLVPSVGTLSPSFSSTTDFYSLKVNQDINTITFQATPKDEKAGIISGTYCTLTNLITDCEIKVKAEAGDIKSYIVRVYKDSLESQINDFKVHNGKLNTTFDENKTNYTLTPDANAEFIYFSFLMNGSEYTSDKCRTNASSCSMTLTLNNRKQNYLFTIVGNNTKEAVEMEEEAKTITPTTPKSTKKKTETNTKMSINQTPVKEEADINKEEEPTIDPIEYNKMKEQIISETEKTLKKEEKANKKNTFLIILSILNIFVGICIGLFLKRKHKNKL